LNAEQPPKPQNRSDLAQERIDIAFKRPQRLTTNITNYKGQRIWFLNGMHTNQLGVIESEGPSGENIRLTDIERTLIDITVRPYYSGGVYEVLGAFRRAKEHDKVSVNRISAMLSKLNYVYPYHQAIGFYLEKTGVYEDSAIDLLRKAPRQFDFYLTHGTTETEYSKSWKLYYPKGL
jgi:hypothetical protein